MNEVRMIDANALKEMGATCFAYRNENGNLVPVISIDNAPTVNPCDNCDLYFIAKTKEEMRKGGKK